MEKTIIHATVTALADGSIDSSECLNTIYQIFDDKEEKLQEIELLSEKQEKEIRLLKNKLRGFD